MNESRLRVALRSFFYSEFRAIVRNSSWSLATTAVTAGALFAETTILARHFGPHRLGVYLLIIAYPEAVQLFLDFRTREAMTKYLGSALARDDYSGGAAVVKLLWLIDLAVVCSAYTIVFATAPLLAHRLTGSAASAHLMRVYGLALLAGGLDATAGSVIRVFDRFALSFAVGAGSMLIRLALIVAAVANGSGIGGIVWMRVVAEVITTSVALGAALVLLNRPLRSHWRSGFAHLSSGRREVLRFLIHTNFQGSLRAAAGKLDVVAVGAIAGPSSASLYKLGVQYGSSPVLFSDPLFSSVYPQFARAHALGRTSEIGRLGKRASLIVAAIGVPTAVLLALLSRPILTAILGPAFVAAWAPFSIVVCGVVPAVVLFWGRPAMLTLGDVKTASAVVALSTFAQFVVLLALVPKLHATGGAAGFAAMNVVVAALTLRYLRSKALV